ncbi:ring-8 [Trichoderma arundinaceum]|uniref:Ring-8 n=1 Tax=Trichoderma arundinaceum TaxID=490622 RepID=A0A395NAP7_TRIAR|nr:ring-8 [Trichoderma arundinaceum]
MAVIDQVLGEVAHIVVRAATTTTTQPPTSTSSDTTSPQTAIPSNTNNSNNNSKGGGSSSPLLFFVALGFGVVFTNLWIIVGVKYCFRYNARNRARLANEDGEPITLENMPRPHRRRREKKLMTMDEVNDKFPMMKYKTWVSERAREGLPTAGGVGTPSRPNSIHNADGAIPDLAKKERASTEVRAVEDIASPATETEPVKGTTVKEGDAKAHKGDDDKKDATIVVGETPEDGPVKPHHNLKRTTTEEDEDEEDEEDDDEHITAALPPELLNTSGDTCAICIDTLEDDDDVRGLTCGHTFHAVCVDPWLTSRRACCPLCKADYYIPKPRPNPEGGDAAAGNGANLDARQNSRMNLPAGLSTAWFRSSSNRNNANANNNSRPPSSLLRLPGRRRAQTVAMDAREAAATHATESSHPAPPSAMFATVRHALRFGRSTEAPPTMNATAAVTPSQLESGTRPTTTTT